MKTRYLIIVPILGLALAASLFFIVGGIGLVRLLLETLVSSGEKVSRCVIDDSLAETDLPDGMISTRPNYFHCEGEIQGLSVGWIDIYESYLPRQWVEIAPLEDGRYAFVSTVNPDQLLFEEDIHNNTGLVYFEIRELRLKIIEGQFFE